MATLESKKMFSIKIQLQVYANTCLHRKSVHAFDPSA
jgi:hypothetical protein